MKEKLYLLTIDGIDYTVSDVRIVSEDKNNFTVELIDRDVEMMIPKGFSRFVFRDQQSMYDFLLEHLKTQRNKLEKEYRERVEKIDYLTGEILWTKAAKALLKTKP